MTPYLITITGPSGAGKSSLEALLCASGKFERIVSTTTRMPRFGDADGAYYFVSDATFDATPMVESVEFAGKKYGVSEEEISRIIAIGKVPVVVVEPNGRLQIEQWAEKRGMEVMTIFIDCPLELRLERLLGRLTGGTVMGPDGVKQFVKRLAVAVTEEMTWESESWLYTVVIDKFDKDTTQEVMYNLSRYIAEFEKRLDAGKDVTDLDVLRI